MGITNDKLLTQLQSQAIRKHLDAALELPPSDEEWRRKDVGISMSALRDFDSAGVIDRAGRTLTPSGYRHVWSTADHVVEEARDIRAAQSRTPCGNSTGIKTIEAGTTYTCSDENCGCRFGRETAEEVVG